MNTQPATPPPPPHSVPPRGSARAGTSLPLANELASVIIGCVLTSPDVSAEHKKLTRRQMDSFENFDVVLKQNTADEVNIVVPSFPELDVEMENLSEEQLTAIAGGEVGIIGGIVFALGSTLGAVGFAAGISGGAMSIGGMALGATIGSVVAGAAIVGSVGAIGAIAIGATAAAIGVGAAIMTGALDMSGPVNVGLAS